MGGCHHLLSVYDASKLSTAYVVKSPVLGLQRAPENSELAPSDLVLSDLLQLLNAQSAAELHMARPRVPRVFVSKKIVYHENALHEFSKISI